jgi:ATP-dependent Clp protease protease subunit
MTETSFFDDLQQVTLAQTLDLPSLDELGVLLITGDIDGDMYKSIVAKIIMQNGAQNRAPAYLTMVINSLGGWNNPTNGILDFIEWSVIPIHTFGVGVCASAGIILIMAGEKGFRYCTNRTQFLSHHFIGSPSESPYPGLLAGRKWEDMTYESMIRHYSQHTNLKSEKEIRSCLLREQDFWMKPEEALEYGIVDHIIADMKHIPTVIFPGYGDECNCESE